MAYHNFHRFGDKALAGWSFEEFKIEACDSIRDHIEESFQPLFTALEVVYKAKDEKIAGLEAKIAELESQIESLESTEA